MDQQLYSRQIFTIGIDAMTQLRTKKVLITGMNGLGLEVAKNVVLSGVSEIVLHGNLDETCFLSSNNDRNEVIGWLRKMNVDILIKWIDILDYQYIEDIDVVVMCNRNIFECAGWNEYCRRKEKKVIIAKSYGLWGNIFCDMGDFQVDDIDGETAPSGKIKSINGSILTMYDINGLSRGDEIEITSNGEIVAICHVQSIDGEHIIVDHFRPKKRFAVNVGQRNIVYNYRLIKKKEKIVHHSLINNIENPKIIPTDYDDQYFRTHALTISYDLHQMMGLMGGSTKDQSSQSLLQLYRTYYQRTTGKNDKPEIAKKITNTKIVCCAPMNSVIGALASNEVIKACTKKFTPINQSICFDELFLSDDWDNLTGLIRGMRIFVVGAGAIGCEHLKNLSLMGVKEIHVTDMDLIEKSNLSRQFLFGRDDIGKFKSLVAAEKIKQINPEVNVFAYTEKLTIDNQFFGSKFFDKIDCVLTALDNNEARMIVDELCIKYEKPMIDCGTLGTKGSLQTIIPYLTKSFGIEKDNEEKIPACTIKMFPNKYEHLVHYAREMFEEYFVRIPTNCKNILENKEHDDNETAHEVAQEDLKKMNEYGTNYRRCIEMGIREWQRIFIDQIVQQNNTQNTNDSEHNGQHNGQNNGQHSNTAFPLVYTPSDPETEMTIHSFSQLWADVFGIRVDRTIGIAIPTREKEPNHTIEELILKIKKRGYQINPLVFDKDNELHIDFIHCLANTRAKNFGIEPQDRLKTQEIVGKIIPAMATTTAFVSGLVGLELYKIARGKLIGRYDVSKFRNGAFNLGINLFGFVEPELDTKIMLNGSIYSTWLMDNFNRSCTWKYIIDHYTGMIWRNNMGVNKSCLMSVVMISVCGHLVWDIDTGNSSDKMKRMIDRPINKLIYRLSKNKDYPIIMTIMLEKNNHDDLDNHDDLNNHNDQDNSERFVLRCRII